MQASVFTAYSGSSDGHASDDLQALYREIACAQGDVSLRWFEERVALCCSRDPTIDSRALDAYLYSSLDRDIRASMSDFLIALSACAMQLPCVDPEEVIDRRRVEVSYATNALYDALYRAMRGEADSAFCLQRACDVHAAKAIEAAKRRIRLHIESTERLHDCLDDHAVLDDRVEAAAYYAASSASSLLQAETRTARVPLQVLAAIFHAPDGAPPTAGALREGWFATFLKEHGAPTRAACNRTIEKMRALLARDVSWHGWHGLRISHADDELSARPAACASSCWTCPCPTAAHTTALSGYALGVPRDGQAHIASHAVRIVHVVRELSRRGALGGDLVRAEMLLPHLARLAHELDLRRCRASNGLCTRGRVDDTVTASVSLTVRTTLVERFARGAKEVSRMSSVADVTPCMQHVYTVLVAFEAVLREKVAARRYDEGGCTPMHIDSASVCARLRELALSDSLQVDARPVLVTGVLKKLKEFLCTYARKQATAPQASAYDIVALHRSSSSMHTQRAATGISVCSFQRNAVVVRDALACLLADMVGSYANRAQEERITRLWWAGDASGKSRALKRRHAT